MPTYNSRDILNELAASVEQMLQQLSTLQHLSDAELNQQPQPGKWSIAQVLEHLNSYNRYYLPEISIALQKGKRDGVKFNPLFKTGWFGNYFTNMMLPKGGKIKNKMTSPKDHRPADRLNSKKVLSEFLTGQQQLLTYLHDASNTNIEKLRVPISISRFVKLKLGDTFRFLIAHQQRHFLQIDNITPVITTGKATLSR